jgi:hypothetical protein
MKTHLKDPTASGQTYSCSICDKVFSRVDTRKRHEAAHSYSLTGLRSMRSVFQQTGQRSTPSFPAWETRSQAENTDEETSSTWTRTRDEAATYRVTTNQNSHGESCWTRRVARGSRDQSLVPEALEVLFQWANTIEIQLVLAMIYM